MALNESVKYSIVALVIVVASTVITLGLSMVLPTGKLVQVPEDVVLKLHIMERLDVERRRASRLASEGRYMDAARIRIHVAGAERCLLASSHQTRAPVSGRSVMLTERMALEELSRIGKDQAYRELLRLLYPEWRKEDSPSSRPSSLQQWIWDSQEKRE